MKKLLTILFILACVQCKAQVFYSNDNITFTIYGISTDVKPVSPPNNCYFIEKNTGTTYKSFGGLWIIASIGVDSVAHALQIKTDSVASALALFTLHVADSLATVTAANLALKQNLRLTATATLDFPSTDKGQGSDLTITLTGAALNDAVILGVPNGSVIANTCFTAWVSASNVVSIRFNNYSASNNLNPASGTFRVMLFH